MFKRIFAFVLVFALAISCVAFAGYGGSSSIDARSATVEVRVNRLVITEGNKLAITKATDERDEAFSVSLASDAVAAGVELEWAYSIRGFGGDIKTGTEFSLTVAEIKEAQQTTGTCIIDIAGYRVRGTDKFYAFNSSSDKATDEEPLTIRINVVYAGEIIDDPTEDDAKEDGETGGDDDDATEGEFTVYITGTDMFDGDSILEHVNTDYDVIGALAAIVPDYGNNITIKIYYMTKNGDDAKGKELTENDYARYTDGGYYIWAVGTLEIPVNAVDNDIKIDQ